MTGRVSDERLREYADDGITGYSTGKRLAAELLDLRDRIARAADAAECIRGATSCIWLGWPDTDWCSACRARAILTGDADV